MISTDTLKARVATRKGGKETASGVKRGSLSNARSERFVLLVGDEGAVLVYVNQRRVLRRLFAPSAQPEHVKTIVELLQAHPKVPLRLLVDVVDQQYVRHVFPPVSALGIQKLVDRRLTREFPPEDLKGALQIGREATGKREWNYLLIGLANVPPLQTWLELVVELPNMLTGVHLVPVEAQQFYPSLAGAIPQRTFEGSRAAWKLLVSHNKVGGFRQVVLHKEKLVFTRLAQSIDDAVAAVVAGNIEQEILNSIEYLRRFDFNDSATLEIVVIASNEVKDALDLQRFNAAGAYVLTPLEVADLLDLEQAALSADCYGDVVLASHFATTRKPSLGLMSRYGRQIHKLYQARLAGRVAAGVIAALIGVSLLSGLVQIVRDMGAISTATEARQALQPELAKLKESIGAQDKDTSLKSAVIATMKAYETDRYTVMTFVEKLSSVLSPEVTVSTINWQRQKLDSGNSSTASPVMVQVEFELKGGFADRDQFAKAAVSFVEKVRAMFPEYTVTSAKLPDPDSGMVGERTEVNFDTSQQPILAEGQNRVSISFAGPHSITATQGGK
ncbi:MAG: hypothetical protein ACK5ZH_08420 [Alphaproteobacteria bacterium]